jgi:phosphatidate cytidylyltransferase
LKNLILRIITGIIFLFILIGAIVWRSMSFGILFSIICSLALYEFYTIIGNTKAHPQKFYGIALGFSLFALNYFVAFKQAEPVVLLLIIPLIFIMFISELFSENEDPFTNLAYTLLGFLYIAVPFSLLNYIIAFPMNAVFPYTHTPYLLLGFFIIIWTNDTFAYAVGSLIGRNKMFERVSPKKSWEGAIGGLIFAVLSAYLMSYYFTFLSPDIWVGLAIVAVVFGNIGDFIESQFKRSVKIKDSGNWLPGHGGMLDRFDSIIFATPFVISYLVLISLI